MKCRKLPASFIKESQSFPVMFVTKSKLAFTRSRLD